MAADMSAPEAISTDAAFSVGFTMIDADPVTGSIATDSAITIAMILRAKHIYPTLNVRNIDVIYLSVKHRSGIDSGAR